MCRVRWVNEKYLFSVSANFKVIAFWILKLSFPFLILLFTKMLCHGTLKISATGQTYQNHLIEGRGWWILFLFLYCEVPLSEKYWILGKMFHLPESELHHLLWNKCTATVSCSNDSQRWFYVWKCWEDEDGQVKDFEFLTDICMYWI